jgi:flagellar biosynthesis repressor protein FlbT
MALKIELKPNEWMILGNCVVTNGDRRAHLSIEGAVPILREKDIMSAREANSPAKRIYLALQLMYIAKRPQENYADYLRLARDMLKALPSARPYIDRINHRILTGEVYKALRETKKLIACEEECLKMNHASKAYAKVAKATMPPRELEATLLLNAAAKLQSVHDAWRDKPAASLDDALLYNRRLWTIFLDALISPGNKLPTPIRGNLIKLGAFVMGETFALMTKPKQDHLKSIIKINRGIAAGLRAKA